MITNHLSDAQMVELAMELLTTVIAEHESARSEAARHNDSRSAADSTRQIEALYEIKRQLGKADREALSDVIATYSIQARAVLDRARPQRLVEPEESGADTTSSIATRLAGLVDRVSAYARETFGMIPNFTMAGLVAPVGVRAGTSEQHSRWKLRPSTAESDFGGMDVYLTLAVEALVVDISAPAGTESRVIVAVSDDEGDVHVGVCVIERGFGSVSFPWAATRPMSVALALS